MGTWYIIGSWQRGPYLDLVLGGKFYWLDLREVIFFPGQSPFQLINPEGIYRLDRQGAWHCQPGGYHRRRGGVWSRGFQGELWCCHHDRNVWTHEELPKAIGKSGIMDEKARWIILRYSASFLVNGIIFTNFLKAEDFLSTSWPTDGSHTISPRMTGWGGTFSREEPCPRTTFC